MQLFVQVCHNLYLVYPLASGYSKNIFGAYPLASGYSKNIFGAYPLQAGMVKPYFYPVFARLIGSLQSLAGIILISKAKKCSIVFLQLKSATQGTLNSSTKARYKKHYRAIYTTQSIIRLAHSPR